MNYAESILELVGNTPLLRLSRVVGDVKPPQRQHVLVLRPLAAHELDLESLLLEEPLFVGGEDRNVVVGTENHLVTVHRRIVRAQA